MRIIRGLQSFFAFVIIVMAGVIIHSVAFDTVVFALVCGLFTFIVVGYASLSEKVPDCQAGYNYWAILSLDFLMAVFWLSSMGANAALRATFIIPVDASCYSDGAAVNSGVCAVYRRNIQKRDILTNTGQALMSAIAGLSALEMLLFIAPLVFIGRAVHVTWRDLPTNTRTDAEQGPTHEMKAQEQPMLYQQQPQQPGAAAPPGRPVYTDQTGYQGAQQGQPQQYPAGQPQYTGSPDQTAYQQSPYPQQPSPHNVAPYQPPQ